MSDSPVTLSTREKLANAAAERVLGTITYVWRQQGVDSFRAQLVAEERLTVNVDQYGAAREVVLNDPTQPIRSRGVSEDALVYFAKQVHARYADMLGGQPVSLADTEPPPFDGAVEAETRKRELWVKGAQLAREERARAVTHESETASMRDPRPDVSKAF